MLNLDLLKDKTIDFMIEGELVKVNEPSISMVKRFSSLEEGEGLDNQINIVVDILNNNTSSKKFSKKQVEKMSLRMLEAIIGGITGTIKEVDNNPN